MATLQDVVDQLKQLNATQESPEDRLETKRESLARDERLVAALEKLTSIGSGTNPSGAGSGAAGAVNLAGFGGLAFGLGGLAKGIGVGLGAAGAGIGAFFLGLAGAEAIMSKFGNGENLKSLLKNLSEGLSSFSDRDLTAVAAVLGAGIVAGAVPGLSGTGAGIGIGAVGVGLGAFFAGLGLGDATLSWLDVDGVKLKNLMSNMAEGLSSFTPEQLGGITALLAGGSLLFAMAPGKTGAIAGLKVATGLGMVGASIGAFFAGLALGEKGLDVLDVDGTKLKNMMKNLAEGLGAFSNEQMIGLGALFSGTGLFAMAAPGAGVAVAGTKIATGMTLVGLSIGGFMAGLSIGDWALDVIGADGSNLKNFMVNIAGGLTAFEPLTNINLTSIGLGMISLAGGLTALLGADIFKTVAGGAFDNMVKVWNWITGDDVGTTQTARNKNRFAALVESLKPFENLDASKFDGLEKIAGIINRFTSGMSNLVDLDVKDIAKQIDRLSGVTAGLSGNVNVELSPNLQPPVPMAMGTQPNVATPAMINAPTISSTTNQALAIGNMNPYDIYDPNNEKAWLAAYGLR